MENSSKTKKKVVYRFSDRCHRLTVNGKDFKDWLEREELIGTFLYEMINTIKAASDKGNVTLTFNIEWCEQ